MRRRVVRGLHVHIDGGRYAPVLLPISTVAGARITTIEGLSVGRSPTRCNSVGSPSRCLNVAIAVRHVDGGGGPGCATSRGDEDDINSRHNQSMPLRDLIRGEARPFASEQARRQRIVNRAFWRCRGAVSLLRLWLPEGRSFLHARRRAAGGSSVSDGDPAQMVGIRIAPDGAVTVFFAHDRCGQGALTSLAMIVAEGWRLTPPRSPWKWRR